MVFSKIHNPHWNILNQISWLHSYVHDISITMMTMQCTFYLSPFMSKFLQILATYLEELLVRQYSLETFVETLHLGN